MQSVTEWAQLNFGTCELGDKRRTRRLVQVAEQVGNHPSASLPNQIERWSDLKAAYRLFDSDQVTFEAIARPHWELTKQSAKGRCLVIGDTTEFDFGKNREIAGLGPTGNGSGQGFLLHNALLVNAESEEIIGVAGQTIHYRKKRKSKKRENASRIKKRKRESEVWGTVIVQIGKPRNGAEYVHVFDRGGDNFEVYCRLLRNDGQWVIRASRMNRYVLVGESEERMPLKDYLPRPRHVSPWVRSLNQAPIDMNVIEVVEVNAHKAIKTGCAAESRQLKAAGRLEAFIGLTSVVAIRLLQLKSLARTDPEVPAQRVVPRVWLQMLKLARRRLTRVHDLTVGQFYREVAMLGGFLGRKSDGDPGWITIWRGWEKLNTYVFVASKLKITV